MTPWTAVAGETLTSRRETPDTVYVVRSGLAVVRRIGDGGVARTLGPGDVLDVRAAGAPHAVEVVALTPMRLLRVDRADRPVAASA